MFGKAGCNDCAKLDRSYYRIVHQERYAHLHNKECMLYVLEFTNTITGLQFIKVGITTIGLDKRFVGNYYDNYIYKQIASYDSSLIDCAEKERHLLSEFGMHKIDINDESFRGRSECLSVDCVELIMQNF